MIELKKNGTLTNGIIWDYDFNSGITFRNNAGDIIRKVIINETVDEHANYFTVTDFAGHEALNTVSTEYDSVCDNCLDSSEQIMTAFLWHGFKKMSGFINRQMRKLNISSIRDFIELAKTEGISARHKRDRFVASCLELFINSVSKDARDMLGFNNAEFKQLKESARIKAQAKKMLINATNQYAAE